jgi:hypothetical protein
VSGGLWTLEVKLSKAGKWHPHLHLLVEGAYIPQDVLSKLWIEITGDSYIVDVRDACPDDAQEVTRYLTKYITKPAGVDVVNSPDRFDQYMVAIAGSRAFEFLGSWRGLPDPPDETEDQSQWVFIGTLDQIRERALAGNPAALRTWAALATNPAG